MDRRTEPADPAYSGARIALLGILAVFVVAPVTLPVTVLRELIQVRFQVSELATSLFMSVNMVGAVLAAPVAGVLADRLGRRIGIIVWALVADAALLFALTGSFSFPIVLTIRFFEGAAHIVALSLLLGLAAGSRPPAERPRVMGLVGGGITLGVAIGAPIGGVLGSDDPLMPLRAGSAIVLVGAVIAWFGLREIGGAADRPGLAAIRATLRANRALLAPLAFSFADRFTVGFYATTFSLYLSRIHEFESPRIGLLMAMFMLPFALLSYPFGRLAERHSRVAMVCGGSLVYGIGTASLGYWPPDALPALMLMLGITSAVMFVPSLVLTTDLAPESVRTTALGAFNAAGSLGFIAGPATGGLVSQLVANASTWEAGYRSAFIVAGAAELLCVAIALPTLLRLARAGRTT